MVINDVSFLISEHWAGGSLLAFTFFSGGGYKALAKI